MSKTITTFQSLQTDSLLSVSLDLSVLKQNFTVMNQFIKNFGDFQKSIIYSKTEFIEMQKTQKIMNDSFSEFKYSVESQFSTVNQILDSRNQISQGKSSAANQQLNQIKKSIKQLKSFVTQSTRQQQEAQEIRQKQVEKQNKKFNQEIKFLQQKNQLNFSHIIEIKHKLQQLEVQSAKKSQIVELLSQIEKSKQQLSQLSLQINQIDKLLTNTKVEEFKYLIDQIDQKCTRQLQQMKTKIKLKATIIDLLKLQQMLLNITQHGFSQTHKIMASKHETRKGLVFLQKRINSLIVMFLGENQEQREAFITTKQLKCISCTKDLGQIQGKLDKVKNWSIFPAKDSAAKQKYPGFGAGFQSIVQSTIAKKGGQVKYDEKGRMIQPFNLTGSVQGTLLKNSYSQHRIHNSDSKSKLSNISPSKSSLKYETSFMHNFGKQSIQQNQMNILEEYYNKFRGLQSFVMSNKRNERQDTN